MSYIRCGSNPEGLYVFESVYDGLEFWWIDEKNKQRKISCKPSVFKQFMKKLSKQHGYVYHKPLAYKNISIREVIVNVTNKKKYKILKKEMSVKQMLDGKIKWHIWVCLKIGETEILMWTVTWECFYDSYIAQGRMLGRT